MTTYASWRYVFAGETVIVTVIILLRGQIAQAPKAEHRPKLDVIGSVLSVAGLGLAVFGILMGSKWGFVKPLAAPTINGHEITPLGFSVVPFMVLAGLGILAGFVHWEERRHRLGLDRLLDPALLKITQLRAGLTTLMGQQLVLMGLFFVVPVYLQVVVGLNAFDTGKRLLPLSAAMLIFALAGPRIAGRRSPRTVAQAGLVLISAGAVVMLATLDVNLNDTGFKIAMVLIGAGGGLLASQLGNVIMSSTDPAKASETGGLQGTAQNLGASIGTALVGAILILNLINGFNDNIADNPQVPRPGARDDRRQHRGGHRHRAGCPGRAAGAFEGPLRESGEGGGGRLRRCPARRAPYLHRRRRSDSAPLPLVHEEVAGCVH